MPLTLPMETVVLAGAAGVSALAFLARRERNVVHARRRLILDHVREDFTQATHATDGAGIPNIEGLYRGQRVRVDLIPDTMTIRRLPQLWASTTLLTPLACVDAGIAVLVRPSGADFYSLTETMTERLDPPATFPWECLVRGQSPAARTTLTRIAPAAARILADAKVKEIAITHRGARILYQLAEGRRGQHLLLRQCDFEDARLEPALLARLVDDLEQIIAAFNGAPNPDTAR